MGSGSAEGKCNNCVKYLLVIFNIVFCFIGIGLVVIGAYAYIQIKDYQEFFGDANIHVPAIVLIVFGCITFVIAGIGCLGAFKESSCLLFVFAAIVGVLLCAEFICGAAAFMFRNSIRQFVTENASDLMATYDEGTDDSVKTAWDLMHEKLECCGASGREDWTKENTTAVKQNGVVPASCQNFTIGCIDSFVEFAYSNVIMLGAAAVAFGTIQVFGIIFSCMLGCATRKALNS